MNELDLNSPEFDQSIRLGDAYLIMFEFLSKNWDGCWSTELGTVMSELSLVRNENDNKCPIDGAVLPMFLEVHKTVIQAGSSAQEYTNADLVIKNGKST